MPQPSRRLGRRANLNRCLPAAADAKLGDVVSDLIAVTNQQTAVIKALVAKLNADTGVASTDYAAVIVDVKTLEAR